MLQLTWLLSDFVSCVESVFESVISKHRSGRLDERGVRALILNVCEIAGSRTLIDDARVELAGAGVIEAVQNHDDNVIFDWLLEIMQFQGVSDSAARAFLEEHGLATAHDIAKGLRRKQLCPKLKSYYHFEGCGFRRWTRTCNNPEFFASCPLPRHEFRNGSLQQMAYALFFWARDIAQGDFVGWVDSLIAKNKHKPTSMNEASTSPLIEALAQVYGVGPKIANLAMATFLLGADWECKSWIKAGASIVVVDTLVHNWLHRTSILKDMGAEHLYGAGCYGSNGCAALLYRLARMVDARRFNKDYPRYFPRFVQFAIWSFCSADGLNICNGNQVDDQRRCKRRDCDLYQLCGRQRLHRSVPKRPTAP